MSTIEGGGQFINNGLRLFYDAKNFNLFKGRYNIL